MAKTSLAVDIEGRFLIKNHHEPGLARPPEPVLFFPFFHKSIPVKLIDPLLEPHRPKENEIGDKESRNRGSDQNHVKMYA